MTADRYKGKYRIPPARWQTWDYGANAAYFVTVCTAHREHFFGEITGGEMQLSAIGQTAHDCWTQIPAHFPFVVLDTFVIMPNHVHGIIVVDSAESDAAAAVETPKLGVSTISAIPAVSPQNAKWYSGTLGVIINQYKRACTMYARQNSIIFAWQSRFNDRVIRDYAEFARIAQYIDSNITNWKDDELYK